MNEEQLISYCFSSLKKRSEINLGVDYSLSISLKIGALIIKF